MTRRLATIFGSVALLAAAGATPRLDGQSYPARRAAATAKLAGRLLIVPANGEFKPDDRAGYQQASDFQYLTGLDQLVGAVLVLGADKGAVLFLPARNPMINRPFPDPTPETARSLEVTRALPVDSLGSFLRAALPKARGVLVSPNDNRGAVRQPPPIAGGVVRWTEWLRTLGWRGEVGPAVTVLGPMRAIKDASEIATLERVGRMSGAAMLAGIRAIKPGRRQRIAEAAVVNSCLESGGRHSFWPWMMSGSHAVPSDLFNSFVDYDNHDRTMVAGEVVRVDVGCQTGHYMGDVGRTAPVSGKFTPGQREAWDLFIAGYQAGLQGLRAGARVADVYRLGLDRIRALAPGLETGTGRHAAATLLGPQGTVMWEIHGVGLDDAEGMPEVLEAGMTVAYELMFAVDGFGFYLEDMILIEPAGYRLLTPGLPYTAAEVERVMGSRATP